MKIKKIIIDSIYIISTNKMSFIKNFLPFLITLLVVGIASYIFLMGFKFNSEVLDLSSMKFRQEVFKVNNMLVLFIAALVIWGVLAKSIVHTHRTFILNEKATLGELFKLKKRDLIFIKKFIALCLCVLPLGIAVSVFFSMRVIDGTDDEMVRYLLNIGISLGFALFWSRLAIVLPSAAMGDNVTINSAWRVSRDYSWTLFLGVGIVPILIDFIMAYIPHYESIIYYVGISLFWVATIIFEVGILSLTYKAITDSQDNKAIS